MTSNRPIESGRDDLEGENREVRALLRAKDATLHREDGDFGMTARLVEALDTIWAGTIRSRSNGTARPAGE